MLLRPLLAFTVLGISALASALTANAALPRDCYLSSPGYELQMFREQEIQMKSWNQVYDYSSYGSSRQREADIKRRAHARAALEMLSSPGALARQPHLVINQLVNEMISRTDHTSFGSFLNQTYRSAQEIAIRAYLEKGRENIRCDSLSGGEALEGAKYYQSVENNTSYGSAKNRVNRTLREIAFQSANLKITQELTLGGLDVRSLQNEGDRYSNLESNSSYGSASYIVYGNLKNVAYQSALETLRRQLNYISMSELYRLDREYKFRENNSIYGSAANRHYRAVGELVRNELNRRSYNPVPYPQPPHPYPVPAPVPSRCPDPNTHYDARIGRCGANR